MPASGNKLIGVEERGRLVPAPHARRHFKLGFDTMANALRPTLGPTGRAVLIEQMIRTESPEILNDAATIAERIVELPLYENSGAMLMRHLVWHVRDQVGDGTATAAVIAQALLRETTRHIAAGANPANLRKGIESGLACALEALDGLAKPALGLETLRDVALAACNDEELVDKLIEIYGTYGLDIVVSLQDWLANETSVEVADGAKWDSGFASPTFVNDPDRAIAWADEPSLVITNDFLERAEQVVPIMERFVAAGGRELVFIAPQITGTALAAMLANNDAGTLRTLGILAPGLGDHRTGVLQDLAALTGARYLNTAQGTGVESAQVEDLGRCGIVWASRDFFAVVDGEADEARVAERVAIIRGALEREEVPFEREQLRLRLGRLTGGVALVGVGAATKTGMAERKVRAGRAVKAIEAARAVGVVPGGGVALIMASRAVETCDGRLPLDVRLGRLALVAAMEEPLRAIVENAGGDPGPVLHRVREANGALTYDALRGELVDSAAAGIVDPANVVRIALRDAVSAGVMATTTEAIVIPKYRLLHASPHP